MPKRTYQPSGKADDGALVILAAGSIVTGLAVGLLEGFVSQWFSLFIVFPIMIGGASGAVAAAIVKARKIRMPLMAGLMGLVGGVLGQLAVMAYAYVEARGMVGGELGVAEWYDVVAAAGTTITKGSSKIHIDGIGFHILMAAEMLLAGGVAAGVAFSTAREPFCERCGRWYDGHDVLEPIDGEKEELKLTKSLLEAGDYARALREGKPISGKRAQLFHVLRCTQCQTSDALLTLKLQITSKQGKAQVSDQWKSMINPTELAALRAAEGPRAP